MNDPELPRQEDLASLRVLEEIERNPEASQRQISRRVGVSLGLTNFLIQRMARKAWIKITTIPGRRVLYALTPRGMAEKVRKTRDFVRFTLRYYSDMRRELTERIRRTGRGRPCVAAFGAGELSRVVAEAVRAAGGRYLGTVEDERLDGKTDVLVLLSRPTSAQRQAWERSGTAIIDLS